VSSVAGGSEVPEKLLGIVEEPGAAIEQVGAMGSSFLRRLKLNLEARSR
jgi:hypothetical protein